MLRNENLKLPCLVHRLVAREFIRNPNNFNCVRHCDSNKRNNQITNLKWVDAPRDDNIDSDDEK